MLNTTNIFLSTNLLICVNKLYKYGVYKLDKYNRFENRFTHVRVCTQQAARVTRRGWFLSGSVSWPSDIVKHRRVILWGSWDRPVLILYYTTRRYAVTVFHLAFVALGSPKLFVQWWQHGMSLFCISWNNIVYTSSRH